MCIQVVRCTPPHHANHQVNVYELIETVVTNKVYTNEHEKVTSMY